MVGFIFLFFTPRIFGELLQFDEQIFQMGWDHQINLGIFLGIITHFHTHCKKGGVFLEVSHWGPTLGSGYIQISSINLGFQPLWRTNIRRFLGPIFGPSSSLMCIIFSGQKNNENFLPFFKAPNNFIKKIMWRYFLWLDVMPSKYLGWTNYIKISTCVFVLGGFLRIFHSGHILGGSNTANLWRDRVNLSLILPYTPENMEPKHGELVQKIFLFKAGWFSGSSEKFIFPGCISFGKKWSFRPAIRWKLPEDFLSLNFNMHLPEHGSANRLTRDLNSVSFQDPVGKLEKTQGKQGE